MNAYRVALILCRAVAVALWWMAGIRFISVTITMVAGLSGLFGTAVPVTRLSLQSLAFAVPLVIVAVFLQIFAASLAASMTGGSAFESDSILSRRTLDANEKSLGNAGAGLFLLFFGAASALPSLLSVGYMILFGGIGSGTTAIFAIYNLISGGLPSFLQCIVGFLLAFLLGLRRVVNSPRQF